MRPTTALAERVRIRMTVVPSCRERLLSEAGGSRAALTGRSLPRTSDSGHVDVILVTDCGSRGPATGEDLPRRPAVWRERGQLPATPRVPGALVGGVRGRGPSRPSLGRC